MMIYNFLKEHWGIIKWIALAIVILQVNSPFFFFNLAP